MSYDTYLLRLADEYMTGCKPTVVESGWEYEGVIDGEPEYSQWFIMNCEGCSEKECEYWAEYNEEEQ